MRWEEIFNWNNMRRLGVKRRKSRLCGGGWGLQVRTEERQRRTEKKTRGWTGEGVGGGVCFVSAGCGWRFDLPIIPLLLPLTLPDGPVGVSVWRPLGQSAVRKLRPPSASCCVSECVFMCVYFWKWLSLLCMCVHMCVHVSVILQTEVILWAFLWQNQEVTVFNHSSNSSLICIWSLFYFTYIHYCR